MASKILAVFAITIAQVYSFSISNINLPCGLIEQNCLIPNLGLNTISNGYYEQILPCGGVVEQIIPSLGGVSYSCGGIVDQIIPTSLGNVITQVGPSCGNLITQVPQCSNVITQIAQPSNIITQVTPNCGNVITQVNPTCGNVITQVAPSCGNLISQVGPSCGNLISQVGPSFGNVITEIAPVSIGNGYNLNSNNLFSFPNSIYPSGVSICGDLQIAGNTQILGSAPFVSTVSLNSALPTNGIASVNYGCGNLGNIGLFDNNLVSIGYDSIGCGCNPQIILC